MGTVGLLSARLIAGWAGLFSPEFNTQAGWVFPKGAVGLSVVVFNLSNIRQLWSAASRRFAQSLVAALTLWLFGVLLALLVAAATAATLIALGLSAALVELLDAAGASRTARSASAKVLLLALATAALIILVAVALLELIGPTRSTWLPEVLLLLALAAATLVEIIAVALLELIGASRSARRTKVLLLASPPPP